MYRRRAHVVGESVHIRIFVSRIMASAGHLRASISGVWIAGGEIIVRDAVRGRKNHFDDKNYLQERKALDHCP
jgi:hypothetical protein